MFHAIDSSCERDGQTQVILIYIFTVTLIILLCLVFSYERIQVRQVYKDLVTFK